MCMEFSLDGLRRAARERRKRVPVWKLLDLVPWDRMHPEKGLVLRTPFMRAMVRPGQTLRPLYGALSRTLLRSRRPEAVRGQAIHVYTERRYAMHAIVDADCVDGLPVIVRVMVPKEDLLAYERSEPTLSARPMTAVLRRLTLPGLRSGSWFKVVGKQTGRDRRGAFKRRVLRLAAKDTRALLADDK